MCANGERDENETDLIKDNKGIWVLLCVYTDIITLNNIISMIIVHMDSHCANLCVHPNTGVN